MDKFKEEPSILIATAMPWLNLLDLGHYSQSWWQTAPFFQSKITITQWQEALNKVRLPLGNLLTRQVIGIQTADSLTNAPKAIYKMMDFIAHYQSGNTVEERLTLMWVDEDWKVVGYFIKEQ